MTKTWLLFNRAALGVVGQFPGSRLFAQLKPGLINASPLVVTYPALVVTGALLDSHQAAMMQECCFRVGQIKVPSKNLIRDLQTICY